MTGPTGALLPGAFVMGMVNATCLQYRLALAPFFFGEVDWQENMLIRSSQNKAAFSIFLYLLLR
jgi:hypothetical protein